MLVGASTKIPDWFLDEQDPLIVRNMLKLLNKSAVLGLTKNQTRWLENTGEGTWRDKQIRDAVKNRVHVWARVNSPDDCEITAHVDLNLPQLLDSEEFEKLENSRTIPQTSKEGPSETFDRFFGHLLPFVHRIDYVDTHFYEKFEVGSGAYFFLERVLQAGVSMSIYTKIDKRITDNYREFVNQQLKDLRSKFQYPPKVEMLVYPGNSRNFPHDRMGRLMFQRGQVPFQIGYGEQIFANNSNMKIGTIGTVAIDYDELEVELQRGKPAFTLPMGK